MESYELITCIQDGCKVSTQWTPSARWIWSTISSWPLLLSGTVKQDQSPPHFCPRVA